MFRALAADAKDMVQEQLLFRELLYQLVRRDLLIRYKQSIMGFGWAVFMPLVNTAVFSVVFMRVAPINVGMPYPLFAYCGLLIWNLSASAWRFSVTSLTANGNLVAKVYFPREMFPFSAVVVAGFDTLVGAAVLVALMWYYRVLPTSAIMILPVVVGVQMLFTTGIALLLAMANLFYRDVKYLFEVVITAWMFGTTVLYPSSQVGGRSGAILRYNPMSAVVDGYRYALLGGQAPSAVQFGTAAVVSMGVFALGWLWFHRLEFEFAESV